MSSGLVPPDPGYGRDVGYVPAERTTSPAELAPAAVSPAVVSARLHPLTPFARGWAAMVAVGIGLGRESAAEADLLQLGLIVAGVLVVGIVLGAVSWWFTRYSVEGDDLRVDTGVLFRRTRHIRLSRLQAVDVVRPLVARFLGLAELRLEVAGGGGAEGRLAYLSDPVARRLRAELLARAAGLKPDEPEAPEQVLIRVPTSAIVGAVLLSTWFVVTSTFAVLVVAGVTAFGEPAGLVGLVPAGLAIAAGAWREFATGFDFTVAESPDGLRLRHGLLEHRSQTVPPGRVQSLRLVEPLLWRARGWVRVQVNVAGYAGGGQQVGSSTSVLLPVAPRGVALALIARILPGVDLDAVPMSPAPRSARWARPLWWRGLACGADDRVFAARRGLVQRQLDVSPHG
jgi:putative membrane protein